GLDLPGLLPNFNPAPPAAVGIGGPYLSYTPANYATPPLTPATVANGLANASSPLPAGGTGLGDFGTIDWRHTRGGLGPIKLNRPLTSYYGVNTAPTAGAVPNPQAWLDRQALAHDIFARLVVATGAYATVFTQTTTVASMPPVTYQPGDVV